jgi:hypothetical protein
MGKYLNKFKSTAKVAGEIINETLDDSKFDRNETIDKSRFHPEEAIEDSINDNFDNDFSHKNDAEVNIQSSQKPESFHHFILENKFVELERDVRGFKDVFNKATHQWELKRKEEHCFTDEEGENIVRLIQSHLSADIKLGWIPLDKIGEVLDALYEEIEYYFRRIAEYQYGRYNNNNGSLNYARQGRMKSLNHKIFLDVWVRIQANYSRSIQGTENRLTHDSVKAQESLQGTERNEDKYRSYS